MSEPALVLDALGLACPMPVLRLARAIEGIPVGAVLEVVSDDVAAKVDIPVWCRMKGHEFLGERERPRGWAFLVRRLA